MLTGGLIVTVIHHSTATLNVWTLGVLIFAISVFSVLTEFSKWVLLSPHASPPEPYFQLRRKLCFINTETPLFTSKMNSAKMFYSQKLPTPSY